MLPVFCVVLCFYCCIYCWTCFSSYIFHRLFSRLLLYLAARTAATQAPATKGKGPSKAASPLANKPAAAAISTVIADIERTIAAAEDIFQLPAAVLQMNAADHSAALAARAAANAGRPRLTPEERAALLARSRADASAHVLSCVQAGLGAAEAETGATTEQRIEKARRFAAEQAAQQECDVIEQQLLDMPFEDAVALIVAEHPELAPK
uniref:Uncharacterized protein n=1 Tax=Tetradesmus obliquus TaxID=3088 RepID=A0A383VJT6_TETOB|eukprot:jgi/Sobl393_1/17241/SZX65170.1